MASGRKTTKAKQNTGKRKTTSRTVQEKGRTGQRRRTSECNAEESNAVKSRNTASSELKNEIILMVALVISVLLLLSHFDLGGVVGETISGIMFGLFGGIAYVFPVILFFGVAFYLANRGNRKLVSKMLYALGMLFMVTAFLQLLTKYSVFQWNPATKGNKIPLGQYYVLARDYKKGGGIFGGAVCSLFKPWFGTVGSYVVVIALFLVFFMLFSRKAIFAWIAKRGNERYALHKAHAMERRESYEERQAERARLVEEKRKELGDRRAKTFLLSEDEKAKMEQTTDSRPPVTAPVQEPVKVKKEKRNFFGGKTPTGEYTMDMNNQYKLPEETISEVNALYGEEKKKRDGGLHIMEISPETGEYKKSTYVEDKMMGAVIPGTTTATRGGLQRMNTPHKGPTVAEQLDALEDDGYRQTSGGQRFRPNSVMPREEDSVQDNMDSTSVETQGPQTAPRRTRAKSGDGGPIEPLVIEESEPIKKYEFPPIDLLARPKGAKGVSERELQDTAMKLQSTLDSFGVRVTVTNVSCGPAVTRYELQPEQGVKVSKITSLADDIKLNLAAADVRIEAPIPGKAAVGIEVPNKENSTVLLRELLESSDFTGHGSNVAFAVGKDIGGQTVVTDIAKMPHLLIAGATGSGKSVCINTLIMSILYKADPSEVKLIMVDPKVVELSVYNGIPHLMIPVVTDPKKASAALNWAVIEMTERYQKFAELGVRDLKGYNERVDEAKKQGLEEEKYKHLPQIVIIVDELADLMMVAPGEVEDSICRLAQLARAAGLHLVIATQRPSVNVITGLIKANIPSRIAFAVSSAIDSRTILDGAGAEKLLGKGDMLFFPSGYSKPVRVQGAFVSDREVSAVVDFLKANNEGSAYNTEISEKISNMPTGGGADNGASGSGNANGYDEYFADAGKLIIEKDKASIGMLQRAYKIGFNRAARIMDQLAEAGVVGPEEGTKPRKVLMSAEEFEQYIGEYV